MDTGLFYQALNKIKLLAPWQHTGLSRIKFTPLYIDTVISVRVF